MKGESCFNLMGKADATLVRCTELKQEAIENGGDSHLPGYILSPST
jgi:hypothetical protein